MRISIHQPNFLPWMGYFYKIAQSDAFVFLDHVEFTKRSYTRRVKIHKAHDLQQEQLITIPLQKHSDHAAIHTLKMHSESNWRQKIHAQIYQSYHKAPYFHQLEPLLIKYFKQPPNADLFSPFTIALIQEIAALLDLHPQWHISGNLELSNEYADVNLDIIKKLKGSAYVSGMGAKRYQNEGQYAQHGITLHYSDYQRRFQNFDFPAHFMNKSIIAYIACYDLEFIREVLVN